MNDVSRKQKKGEMLTDKAAGNCELKGNGWKPALRVAADCRNASKILVPTGMASVTGFPRFKTMSPTRVTALWRIKVGC